MVSSVIAALSSAYSFKPKEQRIDVSGDHKFIAPDFSTDYRGPCPALNALANHGYIPRNGIASVEQIVKASTEVFGIEKDFATFTATYGIAFAASPNLKNLSIGAAVRPGDVPSDLRVGLSTRPQGLSLTHVGLEHDASPTRMDLYEKGSNGNNYDLSPSLFQQLLHRQEGIAEHKVNYNIKVLAHHRFQRIQDSIANNADFFLQPFSGCFFQGNSYAVIYRAFANHSVEHPMGRLDRKTLMSFFGVYKDGDRLKYNKGGERIPDIWYRRPHDDPYDIKKANNDLLEMGEYHPELIDEYCAGSNLAGADEQKTYAAIDMNKLTNGTYKSSTLRDGYNLSCAAFTTSVQTAPWWLSRYYSKLGTMVMPRLLATLQPLTGALGCKVLGGTLDETLFQVFPGFKESLNVPQ
ncbi:Cloroperoxidase [Bimuria novae-zelandiae CBS 107.79]|uniref:Cloroperoxidase n=1 Tax=Bimuria novae-zelandiae CBS 107.79 TaxID=1447943 RepID=A0A6A5V2H6_9PLEO|nr:Cloroperoxidase [Bimuria novae-zelandiae CBS 107.79]